MTRRQWYGLGALVVVCLAVSVYLERKPEPTREQAVAHERTAVAIKTAAIAETLYVTDTLRIPAARGSLRGVRDTLLTTLTDTLRVKEFVAKTDTLIALDSAALAHAADLIRAQKGVIAAKDTELTIALKPHPAPRLRFTVAGLYDPLRGNVSASGDVGLRVIGGVQLYARAEQRLTIERPEIRAGVAVSF